MPRLIWVFAGSTAALLFCNVAARIYSIYLSDKENNSTHMYVNTCMCAKRIAGHGIYIKNEMKWNVSSSVTNILCSHENNQGHFLIKLGKYFKQTTNALAFKQYDVVERHRAVLEFVFKKHKVLTNTSGPRGRLEKLETTKYRHTSRQPAKRPAPSSSCDAITMLDSTKLT